jgi:hypothetical protein
VANISKTEFTLANRAVLLSQNIPQELNDHRPMNLEEALSLVRLVGANFFRLLNNSNISIYIYKSIINVSAKNSNVSSNNNKENNGIAFVNYKRNQYSFIFRGRIVMLTTYLKIDSLFSIFMRDKVVQFDFMFLDDYLHDVSGKTAYNRTKRLRYISKNKLDMSGIRFLLKILKVVESVAPEVTINVCYLEEQRGRIYKKALSHLSNVKFEKIKPTFQFWNFINR